MTETVIDILNRLIAEGRNGREHHVKVSRDFWEEPADAAEFTALDSVFRQEYGNLVEQVAQAWGRPDFQGDGEAEGFPDWYDALELACWRRGEHIAYVAFQHSDKELPMIVVLGAIPSAQASAGAP